MKSAVQRVPQEPSRPDSDLAIVSSHNHVITLPQPTRKPLLVNKNDTVQWQWDQNFSVSFTDGVFEEVAVGAIESSEGCYLTPRVTVTGDPGGLTICTYALVIDGKDTEIGPTPNPPPPPPNVIIVDNSTSGSSAS